ncbi:hypothetical protein ACJX0J_037780, partial [Zea mays]
LDPKHKGTEDRKWGEGEKAESGGEPKNPLQIKNKKRTQEKEGILERVGGFPQKIVIQWLRIDSWAIGLHHFRRNPYGSTSHLQEILKALLRILYPKTAIAAIVRKNVDLRGDILRIWQQYLWIFALAVIDQIWQFTIGLITGQINKRICVILLYIQIIS